MDKTFYWIGVCTVAISALTVFSMLIFAFVGWLIARAGIKQYAELGENALWAILHKGGDVVFDKQPDKPTSEPKP